LSHDVLLLVFALVAAPIVLPSINLGTTFSSSSSSGGGRSPSMFNSVTQVAYGAEGIHNYTGVERNTRSFLENPQQNPGASIHTLSPGDARAVLSNLQARSHITKLPADIENRTIPGGANGKILIQIVRPSGSGNETLPVAMYFHGGGWILGGEDTHDRLLRELADGAHVAVAFVNYTRSPEAKYPVALEEAYAATKWVAENGQAINVNSSRLAVAGDGVGGNMATAVALLAKERGSPKITFQLLFYPVTNANFDTPSYMAYQDGYWLTRKAMMWFWDNYLSNKTNVKEPTVSPLQASIEQLRGLPRALIISGEFDVLRDEGEAYAHKLIQAGVPVTAARYLGTINDFVMLNAITHTQAARGAIDQASHMLKKVLSDR
jgi:acetyl esterase